MDLLLHRAPALSPTTSSPLHLHRRFPSHLLPNPSPRRLTVRFSLPFTEEKAKYYREVQAAVDVVGQACRICLDVKQTLSSSEGQILEKNDQTPVTSADFGVQALISLELGRLFPSIPLVAEEDSAFLCSNNLVNSVVDVVTDIAKSDKPLTQDDVLEAINRGGKFEAKPATYWVLDPIDGTRGFLKGVEALYVVGLALVVEGEIVLGVMGCPNWPENDLDTFTSKDENYRAMSEFGIIMVAHVGCGTWSKGLSDILGSKAKMSVSWTRCFVDGCCLVHKARFCISDSQGWESLPLSLSFGATTNVDSRGDSDVLLLPRCCGSLCKYLMVASGRASVYIQRARPDKIIKVWDHAVGVICVHEAGGMVTDWRGDKLDLAEDEVERRVLYPPGGILVTNASLHEKILQMIISHSAV